MVDMCTNQITWPSPFCIMAPAECLDRIIPTLQPAASSQS